MLLGSPSWALEATDALAHAFFMMNQMTAQPLALVGYLGNGKPPFQTWLPNHSCGLNHWDVLKLYVIGEGGDLHNIDLLRKAPHSNVTLPMSCWAGWANHHLPSHKYYPFGARIDVAHVNLLLFSRHGYSGKTFKIKLGP